MGQCVSAPGADAVAPVLTIQDRRCEEDYAFEGKIGEGMQGVVFAGRHRVTGAAVAIKRTHIGSYSSTAARASAFAEIELLSYVDHPNIVKLIAAYVSPTDVHMVVSKVEGSHLIKYLVRLDEEERGGRAHADIEMEKMSLLRQLIDAIAHAHSRGIVYRDLKPANVMISDRKPRVLTLIDFGRATHLERAQRLENQPPLGTSLFQAPEVEERSAYGQQSDMWAIGVLVYLLVSGRMPFEHSVAGLYRVLAGAYEPFCDAFSPDARDVVARLLVVNPDKRLNAAQCRQHAFFSTSRSNGISAAKRIMAKLPPSVYTSEGCIAALELHRVIAQRTSALLAEQLTQREQDTVMHWLEMSAEEGSGHGGRSFSSSGGTGANPNANANANANANGEHVDDVLASSPPLRPSALNSSAGNLAALETAEERRRSMDIDLEDSTSGRRHASLNVLYTEMRRAGEASVKYRGGGSFVKTPSAQSALASEDGVAGGGGGGGGGARPRDPGAGEDPASLLGGVAGAGPAAQEPPSQIRKSRLNPAASAKAGDASGGGAAALGARGEEERGDSGGGGGGGWAPPAAPAPPPDASPGGAGRFLSVAHAHGLCSLDELIQACRSAGRGATAESLEAVKAELRRERVRSLIAAGLKTTESSNALLDTMLFRYRELFQKVTTRRAEARREEAGASDEAGASEAPEEAVGEGEAGGPDPS